MAIEIERKFLLASDGWRKEENLQTPVLIKQAYLCTAPERTVRIRQQADKAYLTIKGKTSGFTRQEFEYEIPRADAGALFLLCEGHIIEKKRYLLPQGNIIWEIDEFEGLNSGLLVAEVELKNENDLFSQPAWLGNEVSADSRYTNAYLSKNPFNAW